MPAIRVHLHAHWLGLAMKRRITVYREIPQGDWELRTRGLHGLYRWHLPVLWDRHYQELRARRVSWVPQWYRVPYLLLSLAAEKRGVGPLGDYVDPGAELYPPFHPLLRLWSCVHLQNLELTTFPPVVETALDELCLIIT